MEAIRVRLLSIRSRLSKVKSEIKKKQWSLRMLARWNRILRALAAENVRLCESRLLNNRRCTKLTHGHLCEEHHNQKVLIYKAYHIWSNRTYPPIENGQSDEERREVVRKIDAAAAYVELHMRDGYERKYDYSKDYGHELWKRKLEEELHYADEEMYLKWMNYNCAFQQPDTYSIDEQDKEDNSSEETQTNSEVTQTNSEETQTNSEETQTNSEETQTNSEKTETNSEETETDSEEYYDAESET